MTEPRGAGAQPKYQRVLEKLRKAIREGEYDADVRLPAEPELAEQYGVSLMTLRKALDLLKVEGVIEGRQGAGNYARDRELLQYGGDVGSIPWVTRVSEALDVDEVAVSRKMQPPVHVARALGLGPDGKTLRHTCRLLQNGRPVRSVHTYLPYDLVAADALAGGEINLERLHRTLARLGRAPVSADESVRCRLPTSEEAIQLAIPPARFVIHAYRTVYDGDDLPVEVQETIMDSASYVLSYRLAL
ncbi:GntR family transcriptional regulator [Streptomyces lydicus]|uniref:GntR family transcriptional regulator n=1 Tax=Streptomyces lydicus TaxID=47763 RepID=UPI0010118D35|nr:GntR family transcriptional regulator [Streptomyces lydicus]MCZ1012101.1 GntR family transcriptional regulator [Streptomyces lydicus]